jgi:hypothetical protein
MAVRKHSTHRWYSQANRLTFCSKGMSKLIHTAAEEVMKKGRLTTWSQRYNVRHKTVYVSWSKQHKLGSIPASWNGLRVVLAIFPSLGDFAHPGPTHIFIDLSTTYTSQNIFQDYDYMINAQLYLRCAGIVTVDLLLCCCIEQTGWAKKRPGQSPSILMS